MFEDKKPGKVGECIYLTAKSTTASGALSGPRPPADGVLYLQTKPNEQIRLFIFSDREKENYFILNGHNLSYLNRHFVM